MVAIGAYFVVKGLFGAAGFCGVIVTAAIAVAIVHNIDTFTSLGLKTGTVDASVEVARVRDEIFAKAEEVQQLAEQSAAISAWVVSTANRLVGESFQEQLLQRRDELLAMLIDLDVAPERRIAIVMPITRAVANDYRMNILSEARHAVVDAISGTKQQVDAIIREIVAPLENPESTDRITGASTACGATQSQIGRDSTAQWIDTTGFLSRTQTSWNNLEPPYRARECPVGPDCGTGRWCADAGRPTRFKPSSPSPTDAVRDGSAKLGHPVQNVTREHGLTPLPR